VLLAGGTVGDFPPEVNAIHFAPRSRVPTLMLNGENDFINPYEVSQKPLFDLLGVLENESGTGGSGAGTSLRTGSSSSRRS
jgi:hypothetical protein